jgi:hypothetical protein
MPADWIPSCPRLKRGPRGCGANPQPMDENRIGLPDRTSEQSDREVRDRWTQTGNVSFPAKIQRGGTNAATGGGAIERSISTVVVAELGP